MEKLEQMTTRARGKPFEVQPYSSTNLIAAIVLTIIFLVVATLTIQILNSNYENSQQQHTDIPKQK